MISKLILAPISERSVLPRREGHSGGYDVFAYGDHTLSPKETKLIPLGFAAAIPEGYMGLMWDRSSMGAKGITVFGGVFDWSYRGQWAVILHSEMNDIYTIKHGDKIAQFLIQKVELVDIETITWDDLLEIPSERGVGGLGSTDGHGAKSVEAAIAGAESADEFVKRLAKY